jgi:competence protein ComEC
LSNKFFSIIQLRMFAITLGLICGILSASFNIVLLVTVLSVFICAILFCFIPKLKVLYIIYLFFFFIGVFRLSISKEVAANDISTLAGNYTRFTGFIFSDPELREDKISFIFNAKHAIVKGKFHKVAGKILISVYKDNFQKFSCEYGDKLEIISFISQPMPATNPNAFSYKDYLYRQGIYSTASVSEARNIKTLNIIHANPITKLALAIKHSISSSCRNSYSKDSSPVIEGMALGSYSSINPDVYDSFTRTGTLHLLAASGFNCFIIAFYGSFILSLLRFNPIWRCAFIIFLLLIYLLIVGPKPSIVRAAIMASLVIFARPISREADLKNLFYCALFVVLMLNPNNIFDVGFQLSFMGVAALIFFHHILRDYISGYFKQKVTYLRTNWLKILIGKASHLIFETAVGCISVLIFVSPIIAYNFNYISITSIPANILMSGFAQLIYGFGILAPLFAWIPIFNHILGSLGSSVTNLGLSCLNWLSSWRYSSVSVVSPNAGFICIYYIVLILVIINLSMKDLE